MDPNKEKLKTAELERNRYLKKLREQAERRESGKELRDRAIQKRAEHEVKSSQQYLKQITRRAEFRGQVKNIWLESHKTHEEMHQNLGKLYKERLTWHVDRTLASANLRTGVDRAKTTATESYKTVHSTGSSDQLHISPAPQPAQSNESESRAPSSKQQPVLLPADAPQQQAVAPPDHSPQQQAVSFPKKSPQQQAVSPPENPLQQQTASPTENSAQLQTDSIERLRENE
jgi:hypothetical protein